MLQEMSMVLWNIIDLLFDHISVQTYRTQTHTHTHISTNRQRRTQKHFGKGKESRLEVSEDSLRGKCRE